jgi:N-acetyl-anhydromuramyl-L-alanine amidase AmpD
MAAGGKGHAGKGKWRSIPADAGNNYTAALETDHTVGTGWSNPLRRAIDVVSLVVVRNHNIDVDNWMCGHLEYAPTRKQDPDAYALNDWRWRVKTGNIFGGSGQTNWWDKWFSAA